MKGFVIHCLMSFIGAIVGLIIILVDGSRSDDDLLGSIIAGAIFGLLISIGVSISNTLRKHIKIE